MVTVSAVRPLLKHILGSLLTSSADDCSLVKEMKETISDDLSARYIDSGISELIDKCSYLDPRFRTQYLNNTEETLMQVKAEAIGIAETIPMETSVQEDQPPSTKKSKGLGAILMRVAEDSEPSPITSSEHIDKEMKFYLERPPIDPDADPLSWWSSEKSKLPVLAEMARKYLFVGQAFLRNDCLARLVFIVNDRRNTLSPQNLNMLLFFGLKHEINFIEIYLV